ncbi:hypothetical protein L7F22_045935, partial [Adiantum nelumboides]|nr:hypothetical protein [Adiantum nelumboides]
MDELSDPSTLVDVDCHGVSKNLPSYLLRYVVALTYNPTSLGQVLISSGGASRESVTPRVTCVADAALGGHFK